MALDVFVRLVIGRFFGTANGSRDGAVGGRVDGSIDGMRCLYQAARLRRLVRLFSRLQTGMDTVSSRLSDTSVVLPLAQRELAILRFLGRLGMVSGQTIAQVACPEISADHGGCVLRTFTDRKLMWATNSAAQSSR